MMGQATLLALLSTAGSRRKYVEDEILAPVPWIFQGDAVSFAGWRDRVATEASLDAASIYIVGSAATGFSLSPLKPARPFRPVGSVRRASDIDIAIVHDAFFADVWGEILKFDRNGRLKSMIGPSREPDPVARVRLNVYWGAVSSGGTPAGTASARRFSSVIAATTRATPFIGHTAKARVYRRYDDLVSYHEQSLRALTRELRKALGV